MNFAFFAIRCLFFFVIAEVVAGTGVKGFWVLKLIVLLPPFAWIFNKLSRNPKTEIVVVLFVADYLKS
jgi:hypothetical protein